MDLASLSLLQVWRRLGGPQPRGARVPAFWRGSKDCNVSRTWRLRAGLTSRSRVAAA